MIAITRSIGRYLAIGLLAGLLVAGCSGEDAGDRLRGPHVAESDDPAAAGGDGLSEAAATAPGDGVSAAGNGCSTVQYCNAPGQDGARCRQLGCSLDEALAECAAETPRVCGDPPLCPWAFYTLSGQRLGETPADC